MPATDALDFATGGYPKPRQSGFAPFTIKTTDAQERVTKLHDQMPVVNAPEARPTAHTKPWGLLSDPWTLWPIAPKLNSPKNDCPALIDQFEEPAAEGEPVERANEGEADRADKAERDC